MDEFMPQIERPEELKRLIELGAVHVLNVAKREKAYLGFDFHCNWDEEHGLGVMTHGKRVVAIGNSDSSFDEWRAEQDGGRRIE